MNTAFAALVNGSILSVPLALVVWLGLSIVPPRMLNAGTRYAVWWAVLAVTVALPLVYLPLPLWPPASQAAVSIPLREPAVAGTSQTLSPISVSARPSEVQSRRPRLPLNIVAGAWGERIAIAWLLVTLAMLIRLLVSCVLLARRKARAFAAPPQLRAQVTQWLAQCGSRRNGVRIAVSSEIAAPMVAGFRHPSILIPASLLERLDAGELNQVGVHEAAHLARWDDYLLIVQRVVEALFALHPVVRWIARRIDLEREIACDDFVVKATGGAREYAACLTRVMELSGGVRSSLAAAGAAEERSHLALRVEKLLDKSRHTGTRVLKVRLAAGLAALIALSSIAAQSPVLFAFTNPQTPKAPVAVVPRAQSVLRVSVEAPPVPQAPTPVAPLPTPEPVLRASFEPPPAQQAPTPAVPLPLLLQPPDGQVVNTPIVRIQGKVIDSQGRFVTGLDKVHFKLFEDGVEQQITQFWGGDAPLSACVVLDASGSMGGKLRHVQRALERFFKFAGAKGEFCLVIFHDRAELIQEFTTNSGDIESKLTFVQARGKTALLDGIHRGLTEMKKARNPRKALLVICDGGDNSSSSTDSQIKVLLRETGVEIYVISLMDGPGDSPGDSPVSIGNLTREVGGSNTSYATPAGLIELTGKLGVALQNSYALGYTPKNAPRDGAFRTVRVELVPPIGFPPLHVMFSSGYSSVE